MSIVNKATGAATPAMSNSNTVNTASTEEVTMNNVTVSTIRSAFNNGDWAFFKGARQRDVLPALKDEHLLNQLHAGMAKAGIDTPKWLDKFEIKQVAEQIATAAVEERPLVIDVLGTLKGVAAELYAPLLVGANTHEWVRSLAHRNLAKKDGSGEYSALYGATAMANSAISSFNRRLYAAYLVDLIDHERFEQAATKVQDIVAAAASAIAAHGNRDAATHGTALMDVRVRTKDHGAEASGKGRIAELREQMLELAKDARAGDAALAADLIKELQQLQNLALMRAGHSDHAEDSSDSKPADTGWTVASVDTFNHLYSLPVQDVAGLEAEMARALWAGKRLALPTIGRDLMEERLIVAYANAEEYANVRDLEELRKKIEKRTAFFEHGMEAIVNAVSNEGEEYSQNLAGYARWAVNHYTRRIWRDIKVLELSKERYEQKLNDTFARIHREETMDIEPVLTRTNMGEAQELGYTIKLPFIGEFGDDQLDPYATQGERIVALCSIIISAVDEVMPTLRAMYAQYRELDEAHHTIWALMANAKLPVNYPPIYWNMAGWYNTEEEATQAFMEEMAERAASAKDASAAAIADTLDVALQQIGSLI